VGTYRAVFQRYPDGPVLDEHLIGASLNWTLDHPTYPLVVLGWNSARLLGFDGPAWATWSLHTMSLNADLAVPIWISTLLITLLAAIEIARRRQATRQLALVALALFLPAALVNGEMRLAIPLQAVLVVLAACTVAGTGRAAAMQQARRAAARGLRWRSRR
jgi:hypothetical protein